MELGEDEFEDINILGMHSPSERDVPAFMHTSSEEEDQDDEEASADEMDEDMTDDLNSEEDESIDPMEIHGHR